MENTKQYLTTLAGQEPQQNSLELAQLEAILDQIEEDAVSQRSSNAGPADEFTSTRALRRTSFSALQRFIDNIEPERASTTPADDTPGSPPSGTSTNPDEFSLPNNVQVTKQIFFDCDNTLVDTEAIAVEACSIVVNKCLVDHDISETYSVEELLISNFGGTARQMITVLAKIYKFKLTAEEISEYAKYEEDIVIELIHANPLPCDGVERLLQHLQEEGRYNVSVVSSSPIRRIRAALEAAGIAKYFKDDQVFSAKSSMPVPKSKPDPAIYSFAMAYNKVQPWQCVSFEDSRSGARSAIHASVPCIAYLGTYRTPSQREQVGATLLQEGCQEIMRNWSQAIACLERAEKAAAIEVATSLNKWQKFDEKRRQYRMLLGQLLLK